MQKKILSKGVIHAILSAIIFGLMPLFTQIFYRMGADPISCAFYRMLPSVLILYFIIKLKYKISLKLSRRELRGLLFAALGFSMTSITLFSSYKYMSSAAATTIHFAYPIIIFIVSNIIKKAIPKKMEILLIILVGIGVLTIMDLSSADMSTKGTVFAVLSAFTYSFYSISLEADSIGDISPIKLLFYVNLLSVVIITFYSWITKSAIYFNFDILQLLLVVSYSCVITFGATYFYQSAIGEIGASNTSVLSTLEPITSLFVGILILDEKIVLRQIIGIILILFSTTKLVIKKQ